jgi:integrase
MKKREEILLEHSNSIWYNAKEDRWYCHIPDPTKKEGRRKMKRKKQKDIEDILCNYWIDRAEQEALAEERAANGIGDEGAVSVSELFYEFMEYKKTLVSSGTIKRMMADWNKFYVPYADLLQKPFRELTKIDMDNFFNSTLNKYELKKKTFYNMCGILKQMMEYAEDAGYIVKSPYRLKVNPKKFAPTKKMASEKEVYQGNEKELMIREMERRIRENPSNTAPLAVMLDFELGVRKGEIMAIRESDIVDGWIHISRQLVENFNTKDLNNIKSLGFKVVRYTKSEDGDRWIPLTERALEIIRRIQNINEEYNESYQDYLFVRDGYVMSPDTIDAQIKRGCEYIGMPVKTMHKIRKTYASTLLHSGVSISVVKDLLGHADESTTLRHYIYNTETNEDTGNLVKDALVGSKKVTREGDFVRVTKGDQNIISLRLKRKAETLEKSSIPAIS